MYNGIESYRNIGTRDALGRTLADIGDEFPAMVVLAADCMASVRGAEFASKYPKRAFNFGIAEANMMAAAAGMATCGKIPVACTFGFLASLRCCEMIRTSICYPELNVKIAATGSGLSMAPNGTTHHVTEDIAVLRSFANLTVLVPSDGVSTAKAVRAAMEHDGPVYIRLGRGGEPCVHSTDFDFSIGRSQLVRDGRDATLMAIGATVSIALDASRLLESKGVKARVIDMLTLKPIDSDAINKAADETRLIVTIEDHNVLGGMGSAVAELLSANPRVPIRRLGIPDTFCTTGPVSDVLSRYGLSAEGIAKATIDALAQMV